MSDTKLMSLEARPEREDYLNPATREEAPAEAGEPEALRMAYKTGYQEGVEDSDGNFCRDACEEGWGKYLEALRAQPQALFSHPAPDALRVAVEALKFAISWIEDLPRKNASHAMRDDKLDELRQTLVALQAEQGAK